jgi:drug/metabolite transporter (DMT)-like permease
LTQTAVPAPLTPRTAAALLALSLPIWGVNWVVLKVAIDHMPPVWIAFSRMIYTSGVMFLVLAAVGRLKLPGMRDLPIVLSVGVLMMGVYPSMTMIGLIDVESGRAALLTFVTPLWVTPAAVLLLRERLTPLKATGLVVGLAGLGILFNPLGFDWTNPAVVRGNLILLGASVVWAGVIVHLRIHRYGGDPLGLAPWQLLLAGIVVAPVAAVVDAGKPVKWSLELAGMLTYAGPISTFLTIWGVVAISRALPAITTSLGFLATPVAAMLCGALLLDEKLTWTNLLGLAAIVVGLGLVAIADRLSRAE